MTEADSSTVHVSGISAKTTSATLQDFFSFCGTISDLQLHPAAAGASTQTADVKFEKAGAASTAAMLSGGSLDGVTIEVHLPGVAAAPIPPPPGAIPSSGTAESSSLGQEDKPRTAIVAEYLAHGYVLSDDITKRAIDLDAKHGISQRFTSYLSSLDRTLGERVAKQQPPATASDSATAEKSTEEAATSADQVPSLARHVQESANAVLERPDVKEKTIFVWNKFNEYYSAVANHPQIQQFYTNASKTVTDVHEEAKRIAAEKKNAAPAAASDIKHTSVAWLLVIMLMFSTIVVPTIAHGNEADEEPADIVDVKPAKGYNSKKSYMAQHMASEHHIGSFDMASFFRLHDLNSDGVLDRSEIEAIYGVHHAESIKVSPSFEVHSEKADEIVNEVLRRLDKDGDKLITKGEFVLGGPLGLPAFEKYGKNSLGHHYDAESEYFVHHEERYHNTPETQKDDAYVHEEDLEHFAHHDQIEKEEEKRERLAEGMPSAERDQELAAQAKAKGEKYVSPYDAQMSPEQIKKADAAGDLNAGNAAQEAIKQTEHVFHGPNGERHVITSDKVAEEIRQHGLDFQPGETKEGHSARVEAWAKLRHAQHQAEAAEQDRKDHYEALAEEEHKKTPAGQFDDAKQRAHESDEDYQRRLAKNKWLASQRPDYGKGPQGLRRPLDDADRMRKGAPYKYPPVQHDPKMSNPALKIEKYRVKKQSFFGEF